MIIQAKFERGVFRPIDPVSDLNEGAFVVLTIRKPLDLKFIRKFRGILTTKEGQKILRLIQKGRRANIRVS